MLEFTRFLGLVYFSTVSLTVRRVILFSLVILTYEGRIVTIHTKYLVAKVNKTKFYFVSIYLQQLDDDIFGKAQGGLAREKETKVRMLK